MARQASVPKSSAKSTVDAVFEAVEDALAGGTWSPFGGVGTFAAKSREARTGRNPRTAGALRSPPQGRRRSRQGTRFGTGCARRGPGEWVKETKTQVSSDLIAG